MSESTGYEIEVAGSTDGGDRVPDLSPREARERWLKKLRVSKAESTISSYHYRLKHFVEWCEEVGIDSIGEVTGWDLETYETHRRKQGPKPLSLNNELGTLQNFLEYCASIELVDTDLPQKVNPPDVSTDAQVDKTRLHTKDAESLLNYYRETPGEFGTRNHITLALVWFTGVRLGGLRALDLDDYNSDEQHIRLLHRPEEDTPLKNGHDGERLVGLPERVCVTRLTTTLRKTVTRSTTIMAVSRYSRVKLAGQQKIRCGIGCISQRSRVCIPRAHTGMIQKHATTLIIPPQASVHRRAPHIRFELGQSRGSSIAGSHHK